MSVKVYKANQWRILAGEKIAKDGNFITLKPTDKIYLGGVGYALGNSAVSAPELPVAASFSFLTSTEPTTGTTWYVTPLGAGTMDGTSWANAMPGSSIHALLLSASSGDRIYFSEGEYSTSRVMEIPSGISLYGGFRAEDNYAWSGRNSFTNPSKFTISGSSFAWATNAASTSGQVVDGFWVSGYPATLIGDGTPVMKNCYVDSGTVKITGAASNCFFSGITGSYMIGGYASQCVFSNCSFGSGDTIAGNAYLCKFYTCSVTSTSRYLVLGTLSSCTFYNCQLNAKMIYGNITACSFHDCSDIYALHDATNCSFYNCSGSKTTYMIGTGTGCAFYNCSVDPGYFTNSAIKCSFYNCVCCSKLAGSATNTIAVNCESIGDNASMFSDTSLNCTAVNCLVPSSGPYPGSIYYDDATGNKNNLSFNNSGTEFSTPSYYANSAGSIYNAAFALTLRTDNSIAKFTNTGYFPAQGIQDVGDCPDPSTDSAGFAAWLSAFGDWHPLASSFLVGAGVAVSGVTTDRDGVTRPDPPTIGAYEPVQTP